MRVKSILISLLGVGIAGSSVFLAKEAMLDPNGAAIAAEPAMVDVIVARAPIAFGQAIEGHLLSVQPWPAQSVPSGAFIDFTELTAGGEGVRRAKAPLFPGEVLLEAKLSKPDEKVTIVQKLGKNTRAMAISVDAVTAVGGFVTPGDHVDILLTQGGNDGLRTVTILQDIRVIGVDQTSEEQNNAPAVARTVTVEVSPEQSQKLALAQKAGTLSLTLRTLENVADAPLQMTELRDLLLEESPVPEVAKKRTVVIRRANQAEIVEIN